MKASKVLSTISRRDLFKLTGRYGISSVVMGAAAMTGAITLPNIAKAAESTYEKRYAKEPKHQLTLGAAGFNAQNLLIERAGVIQFALDLEERTEGEIRVEFIGDNQICGQLSCAEKAQLGVIDMYSASTQNSAGSTPYLNVLDYAYMFRTRGDIYHFLYSPESMDLLRNPLEERHGLKFLFSHAELRGIQLGSSFADKPLVTSVTELAGTKNRVTGTQLGRIAMELMDLNPVPVAWAETLDALRTGLIDGAETWASAVAYANMSPAVTQSVDLRFFCGTEHTGMNASVFDAMEAHLQDAIMESAYLAQVHVQAANEAALVNTVGFSDPVMPGTIFAENDVKPAFLSAEALREAEEMSSPEFQPGPWEQWRERINGWAGGRDTYQEIYDVARQNPHTLAENVEPRRWWRT
ncbi:TRAP transporter substrate-binding protein DctP [Octadecabacter sp. G9-8]|uniref:TRAP transporter substrate-binding protein DctP n=2 Tax=Pseudomonadota TaxID=1224 RepID=A0ABS9CQQ2_9RHOB|nr:TRAP transporter substrate-binding protein DctP [Octadecabacter dasysiphoniae]MCF2869560.1 TRAP transporter substrate-binding protein DctP [Octadecabacter dasysiphoniae]